MNDANPSLRMTHWAGAHRREGYLLILIQRYSDVDVKMPGLLEFEVAGHPAWPIGRELQPRVSRPRT